MSTIAREAHGAPEPRSRDTGRSRLAISAAARDAFAEHGLGGARVHRIAERADANKRLLCDCFDNKERLFRAVVEEAYGHIGASVKSGLDPRSAQPDFAL